MSGGASVLNNFGLSSYVAANRVGLAGLGAISEVSAEASVDLAIAVGETRVLMALAEELSKVNNALYAERAAHVQHLIQATAELNQQITTLTRDNVSQWRASLDHLNAEMSDLEQQLHADIHAAQAKREYWSLGMGAGAMLLAGLAGWYVLIHRKKSR
jgi:uncharacterized coiled-coil protein SlyX